MPTYVRPFQLSFHPLFSLDAFDVFVVVQVSIQYTPCSSLSFTFLALFLLRPEGLIRLWHGVKLDQTFVIQPRQAASVWCVFGHSLLLFGLGGTLAYLSLFLAV